MEKFIPCAGRGGRDGCLRRWRTRLAYLLVIGWCFVAPMRTGEAAEPPALEPGVDIPSTPLHPLPPSVKRLRLPWRFVDALAFGPDDTIYMEGADGWPIALEAFSPRGKARWTSQEFNRAAAFGADGSVYGFSSGGKLCALDAAGKLKWKRKPTDSLTDSAADKEMQNSWVAVGADGTVYTDADRRLSALDSSGNLKWVKRQMDFGRLHPILSPDGTIYVLTDFRPAVVAYAPDGTQKWSYEPFLGHQGSWRAAATAPDGTLYADGSDGRVHALRPDGTVKWKFLAGSSLAGPVVAPDGTILVQSTYPPVTRTFAISPDGLLKWVDVREGGMAPVAGSGGTIYRFDVTSKVISAYSPDDTLQWKMTLEHDVYGEPVVTARGTVYLVSHVDNSVYIIQSAGTRPE